MTSLQPTVFVVDDEPAVRNSLSLLLKSLNLKAKMFPSAEEFLKTYDGSLPGCLLLDERMPGMSGHELQLELNQKGMSIPVIIMTGHGEVSLAVQAMKAGALDIFEKPFDSDLLLKQIQVAIEQNGQPGILTRLAKRMTPQEAAELYKAIAPRLVLGILDHLDRSTNVETVRQLANHLCSPEVQERLRGYEHIRDGIIDELCHVLKDAGIGQTLNRDSLLEVIDQSGVKRNLITLEACLVHGKAA